MICEAFIIAWNREDSIHLTIRHYQQFCQRVVIFDNFSEDKTREIAVSLGADVRLFGTKGVLDDQAYIDIKNSCWKSSNADWVIVCDDDEILWHPDLKNVLENEKGKTIFRTQGYAMHSENVPYETWLEVNTGTEDDNYSKLIIFNPRKIQEIGYVYGCHEAKIKGLDLNNVGSEVLSVLHYRSVGGVERLIDRHHEYEPRRRKSAINMKWGLGSHYSEPDDLKRQQWQELAAKSRILF